MADERVTAQGIRSMLAVIDYPAKNARSVDFVGPSGAMDAIAIATPIVVRDDKDRNAVPWRGRLFCGRRNVLPSFHPIR